MAARPGAVGTTSPPRSFITRSEEHTSELQSRLHLVCRLLLEKKKNSLADPSRVHPFKRYARVWHPGPNSQYTFCCARRTYRTAVLIPLLLSRDTDASKLCPLL